MKAEKNSTNRSPIAENIIAELTDISGAGSSEIGSPHLRKQMQGLYLGLSHAGGDDYRPVEPEKEEISIRDLLLRSPILRVLQGGADKKGSWSGRYGMGGGRLG